MVTLLLREGENQKLLQFNQSEITIGRSRENTIQLSNIKASRKHAKIEVDGGTVQISDLGSGNGTRVNGEKVTFHVLSVGDEIKVGDASLVLKDLDSDGGGSGAEGGAAGSTADQETEIEVRAVDAPVARGSAKPAPKLRKK